VAKSDAETRREIAQVRALIGQGKTDWDILKEVNVTLQTLSKLKQRLFSDELDQVQNETAAENWVRYHLKMGQNIDDLTAVIVKAKESDQAAALTATVGAIKAKADLIDRVFDKGQQLGVIPTVAPDDNTDYPTEIPSLQSLVEEKTQLLGAMAQRYGVADYADLPDIPEESMYFDEPTKH
jgi:hypothetical protein